VPAQAIKQSVRDGGVPDRSTAIDIDPHQEALDQRLFPQLKELDR
jgi:hypothetical protein